MNKCCTICPQNQCGLKGHPISLAEICYDDDRQPTHPNGCFLYVCPSGALAARNAIRSEDATGLIAFGSSDKPHLDNNNSASVNGQTFSGRYVSWRDETGRMDDLDVYVKLGETLIFLTNIQLNRPYKMLVF